MLCSSVRSIKPVILLVICSLNKKMSHYCHLFWRTLYIWSSKKTVHRIHRVLQIQINVNENSITKTISILARLLILSRIFNSTEWLNQRWPSTLQYVRLDETAYFLFCDLNVLLVGVQNKHLRPLNHFFYMNVIVIIEQVQNRTLNLTWHKNETSYV